MIIHYFLGYLIFVTYINKSTHREFNFIRHHKVMITYIFWLWKAQNSVKWYCDKKDFDSYGNIKRRFWLIWYVISAWNFVSRPNPCYLRRIMVFVCRCIHFLFQIVIFLLRSAPMGLYPWVLYHLYVREGGGAKLEEGVDSNGSACASMRDTIFAQNIYCANRNPDPYAHSSSQVYKGLQAWAL